MRIFVREGNKERYTILSKASLEVLRTLNIKYYHVVFTIPSEYKKCITKKG